MSDVLYFIIGSLFERYTNIILQQHFEVREVIRKVVARYAKLQTISLGWFYENIVYITARSMALELSQNVIIQDVMKYFQAI